MKVIINADGRTCTTVNPFGKNIPDFDVCQKLNQQPQYDMFWIKFPDGSAKLKDYADDKETIKKHALIDVQNTIDALLDVRPPINVPVELEMAIERYEQVKEHIKQL